MTPVDIAASADALRAKGLRVTAPRVTILWLLSTQPGHHDVETLRAQAVEQLGALSLQAVYDVVGALTRAQLIQAIETPGRPARYEARVGDNHHHIVCRGCGRTEDVDCTVGSAPCLEPSQSHGFVVDEAEVTYWGLCPSCTPTRNSPRPTPVRSSR
jgi:Fur family transcriptional regulator, stress-responsive regulator